MKLNSLPCTHRFRYCLFYYMDGKNIQCGMAYYGVWHGVPCDVFCFNAGRNNIALLCYIKYKVFVPFEQNLHLNFI